MNLGKWLQPAMDDRVRRQPIYHQARGMRRKILPYMGNLEFKIMDLIWIPLTMKCFRGVVKRSLESKS